MTRHHTPFAPPAPPKRRLLVLLAAYALAVTMALPARAWSKPVQEGRAGIAAATAPDAEPAAADVPEPQSDPQPDADADPDAGSDPEPNPDANPGTGSDPDTDTQPEQTPESGWDAAREHWYENGEMVRDHAFYDPEADAWYWADADGTIARDKDVYIPVDEDDREAGGKWVRFDEQARMVKGEDYRYGAWYHFDEVTGAMSKGMTYLEGADGPKWVYYDWIDGKMAHGERYVDYDAEHTGWYLFDAHTGAMQYGFAVVGAGDAARWVYYDEHTGIMVHGLAYIDGAWYYLDATDGGVSYGMTYVPEWGTWRYFDRVGGRWSATMPMSDWMGASGGRLPLARRAGRPQRARRHRQPGRARARRRDGAPRHDLLDGPERQHPARHLPRHRPRGVVSEQLRHGRALLRAVLGRLPVPQRADRLERGLSGSRGQAARAPRVARLRAPDRLRRPMALRQPPERDAGLHQLDAHGARRAVA